MSDATVQPIEEAEPFPPRVGPFDDETLEAMQRLREAESDVEVGRIFNISRQRVHSLLGQRPAKKHIRAPIPHATAADLPDYLKAWREKHNVTMAEAARLCGTNQMSWYAWESNRTGCSMPGLLLRYLALLDETGKIR